MRRPQVPAANRRQLRPRLARGPGLGSIHRLRKESEGRIGFRYSEPQRAAPAVWTGPARLQWDLAGRARWMAPQIAFWFRSFAMRSLSPVGARVVLVPHTIERVGGAVQSCFYFVFCATAKLQNSLARSLETCPRHFHRSLPDHRFPKPVPRQFLTATP